MNNLIIKDNEKIENLIYGIRDKQVMLDNDLGRLYGVQMVQKLLIKLSKETLIGFLKIFIFN